MYVDLYLSNSSMMTQDYVHWLPWLNTAKGYVTMEFKNKNSYLFKCLGRPITAWEEFFICFFLCSSCSCLCKNSSQVDYWCYEICWPRYFCLGISFYSISCCSLPQSRTYLHSIIEAGRLVLIWWSLQKILWKIHLNIWIPTIRVNVLTYGPLFCVTCPGLNKSVNLVFYLPVVFSKFRLWIQPIVKRIKL